MIQQFNKMYMVHCNHQELMNKAVDIIFAAVVSFGPPATIATLPKCAR